MLKSNLYEDSSKVPSGQIQGKLKTKNLSELSTCQTNETWTDHWTNDIQRTNAPGATIGTSMESQEKVAGCWGIARDKW